jgi:hypothetical protein
MSAALLKPGPGQEALTMGKLAEMKICCCF